MLCDPIRHLAVFRGSSLYLYGEHFVLRLDVSPEFSARILDWRSPRAGDWAPCFPRLELHRVLETYVRGAICDDAAAGTAVGGHWRSRAGWDAFFAAVGPRLCCTAARFGSRQFDIIYYAKRCPDLLRLIRANPGLGFAVVCAARRHRGPQDDDVGFVRQMIGRREKDIAAALGFPPGCWRLLRRISLAGLTARRIDSLRTALADPRVARIARHLPHFGVDVLELLGSSVATCPSGAFQINNAFYHELSGLRRHARRPEIARQVLTVADAHSRYTPTRQVRLRSLKQVPGLTERYLMGIDPVLLARIRGTRLPRPPIPGNDCIRPLETGDDMIREGLVQRNCTATYCDGVAAGECYFYRVEPGLGFERSTAMLVREVSGSRWVWYLFEVRAYANQPARRSTRESLLVWLADAQQLSYEPVQTPFVQTDYGDYDGGFLNFEPLPPRIIEIAHEQAQKRERETDCAKQQRQQVLWVP